MYTHYRYEEYRDVVIKASQGFSLSDDDIKLLVHFFDITAPVCALTKFKFRKINLIEYLNALINLYNINGYTIDESYLIEMISDLNIKQSSKIAPLLAYIIVNGNYDLDFFGEIVSIWLENNTRSFHTLSQLVHEIRNIANQPHSTFEVYRDIIEREYTKKILIGD